MPLDVGLLEDFEANRDRLDISAAAARLDRPWLIVHGDTDETVPVGDAHGFFAAASHDRAKLQIVGGGSHTLGSRQPWAGSTAELGLAMGETVGWFVTHLF